jgi:hypothetical protein
MADCFCFANPSSFLFLLGKPFRFFVFASQTLQFFRLALRKKAQYVVVPINVLHGKK